MPSLPSPDVVEQAIGEHLDCTPLDDPNKGKNPHAAALGRLGRVKGAGRIKLPKRTM